jgi:hypothetical protein
MKMITSKHFLNIKVIIFTFVCLSIQGCSASVQITGVDIELNDLKQIVFFVKTDKNINEFTNSYYAYKVMLQYHINGNKFIEDEGISSSVEQFPFSAKRIVLNNQPIIDQDGNFISKWVIPTSDEVNISGRKYYYNIDKFNGRFGAIKLYGATMGGGHLGSPPYQFQIE